MRAAGGVGPHRSLMEAIKSLNGGWSGRRFPHNSRLRWESDRAAARRGGSGGGATHFTHAHAPDSASDAAVAPARPADPPARYPCLRRAARALPRDWRSFA